MNVLPAEFVSIIRAPGFAEQVNKACSEQYLRHSETDDSPRVVFFAADGVFARPERQGSDWFIDSRRDAWILVPSFSILFPTVFGLFAYLIGGFSAALIVGGVVFFCASVVIVTMVFASGYMKIPVIRNRRWVWGGRDTDLDDVVGILVINYYFVRCLVGIRSDSRVHLLATHVGGPLIRLVRLAGYPLVDGRCGFENPVLWPEWR